MRYLAVLITVFNRKTTTLSCLRSLYAQQIPEYVKMHVYMTNDGCTDGTPDVVKQQFPGVRIINGDGTLYWNRGMWTAWQVASRAKTYDWYLWLNDDTELMPDALHALLTESGKYTSRPNIIVGATRASDSDMLTYGGRIKSVIQPCDGTAHPIDYFNGNIVLVSGTAFDVLGNLDYHFTHSRGDYDYAMRAKKAGVTMMQCGRVLGVCDKHKTIDRWCDPMVPLRQRWRLMHKPDGMPPKEIFHLEHRHYGLLTACFHYCTVYLRCLFPKHWMK